MVIIGWYLPTIVNAERLVQNKSTGVYIYDRNNRLLTTYGESRRQVIVQGDTIPQTVKKAVVSMEDKEFYHHHGFSLKGIARALFRNFQAGKFSEGGSTISQQVIKTTVLTPERNLWRKYREFILALVLEQIHSKDSILTMYLNTVYFGRGAYGIEAAANTFFDKPAAELSDGESLYLIGLIASPSIYQSEDFGKKRQAVVAQSMVSDGYLSLEDKEKITNTPLIFKQKKDQNESLSPHFSLYIYEQLKEKYGKEIDTLGYHVVTTLDSQLQETSERVVTAHIKSLRYRGATNGSVVVLDPTNGEILAMVGSHDWNDETNGKINMAIRPRQVGSSFKPIIYAAAFDKNIVNLSTLLPDVPTKYPTPQGEWKPANYDKRFRGPVLPRRALANSFNLPAVAVMNSVGLSTGVSFAKSFGFSTLKNASDYGLSFVLGAAEIPLLDMTRAYAVFADNGELPTISAIKKITDKYGKEKFSYVPKKERIIKETTAFLINSILSDQRSRNEVFGSVLNTSVKAAVKTGTSENYRDSLTLGYTPNLVIGVWVGNNDNHPMDSVAGSVGAAPIYRELMETFSKDRPQEDFQKPSSIDQKLVCVSDRLLPFEATPSAIREYMIGEGSENSSCKREIVHAN